MDNAVKYKIVEKIIQSDDEVMLNDIISLLGIAENDFWLDLPTNVKDALNDAKDELANGKGLPHNEVMAEVKARFLK